MKNEIILEIDGVRHKLIKTKAKDPCEKCSLSKTFCVGPTLACAIDPIGTHFRKCKPGE